MYLSHNENINHNPSLQTTKMDTAFQNQLSINCQNLDKNPFLHHDFKDIKTTNLLFNSGEKKISKYGNIRIRKYISNRPQIGYSSLIINCSLRKGKP